MKPNVPALLTAHRIRPSAQRVAIGRYVLSTVDHPSADEVLARVREGFPEVSRATVYNTLNAFVRKGLLKEINVSEGPARFDPKVTPHHHFVDEATGRLHDLPFSALSVRGLERLSGLKVRDYEVVVRGRRKRTAR